MSREDYMDKVIELIELFGIRISTDDFYLAFAVESTIQDILNFCNLKEIPVELEHVIVRRVLAKILDFKLQTSDADSINIEKGIRSITEGDVSISYDTSLDRGVLLSKFIKDGLNYGTDNLYSFRDFRW
jgi:hypothetical protein